MLTIFLVWAKWLCRKFTEVYTYIHKGVFFFLFCFFTFKRMGYIKYFLLERVVHKEKKVKNLCSKWWKDAFTYIQLKHGILLNISVVSNKFMISF